MFQDYVKNKASPFLLELLNRKRRPKMKYGEKYKTPNEKKEANEDCVGGLIKIQQKMRNIRCKMGLRRTKLEEEEEEQVLRREKEIFCDIVQFLKKKKQKEEKLITKVRNREVLIAKERKKFYKELFTLRRELFKKEKNPSYDPSDFSFGFDCGKERTYDDKLRMRKELVENGEEIIKKKLEYENLRIAYLRKKNRSIRAIDWKNNDMERKVKELEELREEYTNKMVELTKREKQGKVREGEFLKKEKEFLKKCKTMNNDKNIINREIERQKEIFKEDIEDKEKFLDELNIQIEVEQEKLVDMQRRLVGMEERERIKEEKLKKMERKMKKEQKKLQEEKRELESKNETMKGVIQENEKMIRNLHSEKLKQENEIKQELKKKELEKVKEIVAERPLRIDTKYVEKEKKEVKKIEVEIDSFKEEFDKMNNVIFNLKERLDFYVRNDQKRSQSEVREEAPDSELVIVFTDIENSTKFWERSTEMMIETINLHNQIAREIIASTNGYECKTEGDSFMISFQSCEDAIKFSVIFQLKLMEANWPSGIRQMASGKLELDKEGTVIYKGIRVRIGMNYGKPIREFDNVTRRYDYFGPIVNKAARIESVAFGGSIAIGESVYEKLKGVFGDEKREVELFGSKIFVKSVGEKELKGVKKKEEIRMLFPYELRERQNRKVVQGNWTKLKSVIKRLDTRREDLEKKRSEIRNKISVEVKIRSLEETNTEKENVIKYLRKKLFLLKENYKIVKDSLAKDESNREVLETEMNIKKDVEKIFKKYKMMEEQYSELRKSYDEVEVVFNEKLKREIGQFETDIEKMNTRFQKTIERSKDEKKIWSIEKRNFRKELKIMEKEVKKKDKTIAALKNTIDIMHIVKDGFQKALSPRMPKVTPSKKVRKMSVESKQKVRVSVFGKVKKSSEIELVNKSPMFPPIKVVVNEEKEVQTEEVKLEEKMGKEKNITKKKIKFKKIQLVEEEEQKFAIKEKKQVKKKRGPRRRPKKENKKEEKKLGRKKRVLKKKLEKLTIEEEKETLRLPKEEERSRKSINIDNFKRVFREKLQITRRRDEENCQIKKVSTLIDRAIRKSMDLQKSYERILWDDSLITDDLGINFEDSEDHLKKIDEIVKKNEEEKEKRKKFLSQKRKLERKMAKRRAKSAFPYRPSIVSPKKKMNFKLPMIKKNYKDNEFRRGFERFKRKSDIVIEDKVLEEKKRILREFYDKNEAKYKYLPNIQ